jgi:hypothetical protein
MARFGSSSFSAFLVDGVSLLPAKLQGVTHKVESITEKSDGLGDTSEAHSPVNMLRASLTQDGAFFNDGVGSMHELLKASASAPRQVLVSVDGVTFFGGVGAMVTSYEVISKGATLTKANAAYQVTGDIDEGVILQNAAQTVDWNGTTVDSGASSANGGVGFMQVTALAGLTGFLGFIEDSPDGVVWSTLIAFVNVAAAPASQRIEVAGVVDQYLRFRGDVAGAGSLSVFGGFARK